MKPSDIEVGKTYVNKGKGRTSRTVLEIGTNLKASWLSDTKPPYEPVVKYRQGKWEYTLYLSSFAAWCGKEKEGGE